MNPNDSTNQTIPPGKENNMQEIMNPLASFGKQWAWSGQPSRRKTIRMLFCLTFILFCATAAPDLRAESGLMSQMGVLEPKQTIEAPDFTLVDIMGNTKSLSDFNEGFVMLNFWATW